MLCQICRICVVGNTYELPNGICDECGLVFPSTGTYLGWVDDRHVFRLHKSVCPDCGFSGNYGVFECDDFDGLNVTEEFQVMNNRKNSHWIGR